ncbi:MAG: hypothetical protein IJH20_02950 [Bacilli bacterium]|nr:hypothetical protein [Bacilli bacterium]
MIRKDKSNTLDGINNNTYELLFSDERITSIAKDDREFLAAAIQEFTKLSDEDIDYVIRETNIFKKNGKMYEARKESKIYRFSLLDYFLEERKDELRSEDRLGKCTEKSISLAMGNVNKSKVVIGYLDNSVDKVLHAIFVDYTYDKEYVFDYSMNIVMEKRQYLELMDYDIINEIESVNIKKDKKILDRFDHFGTKFYLCYRDEIMNNLEKNKKVLRLED